jgi:hypothetical protein
VNRVVGSRPEHVDRLRDRDPIGVILAERHRDVAAASVYRAEVVTARRKDTDE